MPPHLTPQAIRVAVLIAAHRLSKDHRAACLKACIAEGIALAEEGL